MMNFLENKTDAVEFVNDLKQTFPKSLPSITITSQGKYVVCSAPHATGSPLENTKALVEFEFFSTQANT